MADIRTKLLLGAAVGGLALFGVPVAAQETAIASQAAAEAEIVREQQRYAVRMMMQVYDGSRDFSHTQMLGIGRVREGDRSFTQFDYGDGAVVMTGNNGTLAASNFVNLSGTEKAMIYDYRTKMMYGDDAIASFHNGIVVPLLGNAPDLGQNVNWSASLTPRDIGLVNTPQSAVAGGIQIELSREYFTHNGMEMVLVRYVVPSFAYTDTSGRTVVHWGTGVSLSDPGFGMVYLNSALHRSVASDSSGTVPYRFARTVVAANPDGSAMVDYRDVAQLAPYVDELFGADAMRVVPTGTTSTLTAPIDLARTLDVVALSIAEDGGNEAPMLTNAQMSDDRGAEFTDPSAANAYINANANAQSNAAGARAATQGNGLVFGDNGSPSDSGLVAEETVDTPQGSFSTSTDASAEENAANQVQNMTQPGNRNGNGSGSSNASGTGANSMTDGGGLIFGQPNANDLATEEATHTIQNGSNGPAGPRGQGGQGSFGGGLGDEVSPETLELLEQSADSGGGLQGNLNQYTDNTQLFGGGGGDTDNPYFDDYGATGQDGSLAQSQYWLDKAIAIFGGAVAPLEQMATAERTDFLLDRTTQLARSGQATTNQINQLTNAIENTENWLRTNGAAVPMLTGEAAELEQGLRAAASRLGEAEGTYEALIDAQARFSISGVTPPDSFIQALDAAESEVTAAQDFMRQSEGAMEVAIQNGKYILQYDVTDPATANRLNQLGEAYRRLGETRDTLTAIETEARGLSALVRSLPTQQIADALDRLGNSPAGKLLDGLSHGMNLYSTGKSAYNVYNASTNDMSSGDLDLVRSHSPGELGLDILALLGNAASGNVKAFYSDAVAISAGSISDIYVANKAWNDTIILNQRLNEEVLANMRALTRRLQEQEKVKYEELMATEYGSVTSEPTTDGGVSDPNWKDPRIDPETGLPKPAYWEHLKKANPGKLISYGIDPEAPVGGWPGGIGPEHRPAPKGPPPPPAQLPEFPGPDYPTAPPRDPNTPRPPRAPEPTLEEQGFVTETPEEQWLRETREENARAAQELEEYQAELLANREEETIFDGDYEMNVSELEVTELVVSQFEIEPVEFEPVTFDPPTWEPPTWEPPEWVPPEFDPPEVTSFPPTDPDDQDGYPGTGEYPAYGFDNMSGTVNVDLSQWEDWLATQDIRKLIQLAIAAGYPFAPGDDGMATLAVALADAENIIRLSQDEGYRQWANQAPSCSGYVGCGPQYLGRWAMKRSIVALGDILVQSREIFSTGGFSDIGISGFNLSYMLRDFGIQDGDLIDVEITQFGRTIGGLEGHFLTTAGDSFNVNLRPGVASVVVTALNEGSASPNTAEVTIDNVVRGEGRQTYDLNTGQTATLRIEANASAE